MYWLVFNLFITNVQTIEKSLLIRVEKFGINGKVNQLKICCMYLYVMYEIIQCYTRVLPKTTSFP